MNLHPALLLSLGFTLPVAAQVPVPTPLVEAAPTSQTVEAAPVAAAPARTASELDALLGPIALYPDALVALILPASTHPADVVMAARYLASQGDPAQVEAKPWDASLKSLVHYPEIVKWLDQNLEWTQMLGDTYATQSTEVMNAIQRLRIRARAAGTLKDTPQQQVVQEGPDLRIVPAQPQVIYVPVYDPAVVYVSSSTWVTAPALSFGPGYSSGIWLNYDVNWRRRNVWQVSRPVGWNQNPHWGRPVHPYPPRNFRVWSPPVPGTPRPPYHPGIGLPPPRSSPPTINRMQRPPHLAPAIPRPPAVQAPAPARPPAALDPGQPPFPDSRNDPRRGEARR